MLRCSQQTQDIFSLTSELLEAQLQDTPMAVFMRDEVVKSVTRIFELDEEQQLAGDMTNTSLSFPKNITDNLQSEASRGKETTVHQRI